jgi:hypothetical protein
MSDQEEKKMLTRAEINRRYIARKTAEDPDYIKKQSAVRKANRLKKKEQEKKDRIENPENYDDEDEKEMDAKGLDKSQRLQINKLTKDIKEQLIKSLNTKEEINVPTIVQVIKARVKKTQISVDNNTTKNSIVSAILKANPNMKPDTITQYVGYVGNIYNKMFDKEFKYNNFDWLKDDEKVMDFVNGYYSNLSSKRTMIGRIYNLLPYLAGLDYLIDRYKGYKKSVDDVYDKEREEGKLTVGETRLWLAWETIKKKVRSVTNPYDSLLTKFYTDIPPRRTRAYCLLKVVKGNVSEKKLKSNDIIPDSWTKSEQEIRNDKGVKYSDYNYAVFKSGKLTKIILNQYKTANKYGVYEIKDIPESIQRASTLYLSEAKLDTGNPLFPNTQNKHYTNQGFSGIIKDTFEIYTDKRIGSNILRHSFATDWAINNPNPTPAKQKLVAKQLGHKAEMFQQYKRFVESDPELRKQIKYNLPRVSQVAPVSKKAKKAKKAKK